MRRVDLPSGTVTFVFTDVEGSTRLLEELGEAAFATALLEHRRVVRGACARNGGVEVDTQGDAFLLAFPTAPGALAAASELQEALGGGRVRLRVGLHTGTPLLTDEGYVGVDLHRAARIAAAGHGGQVLLSSSTAALVGLDGLEIWVRAGSRTWPPPSASTSSVRPRFRRSSRCTGRTCRYRHRLFRVARSNWPRSSSCSAGRSCDW